MKQVCVCARENFKVIRCRIPKVTLSQPIMCVTVCVCVCVCVCARANETRPNCYFRVT